MGKKKEERYVAGIIPTATAPVIIDREEKDDAKSAMSIETALAKIMNDVAEIKESM